MTNPKSSKSLQQNPAINETCRIGFYCLEKILDLNSLSSYADFSHFKNLDKRQSVLRKSVAVIEFRGLPWLTKKRKIKPIISSSPDLEVLKSFSVEKSS